MSSRASSAPAVSGSGAPFANTCSMTSNICVARVGFERSHARRLLIEAAWHQRTPTRLSVTLERRREGKPLADRVDAVAAASLRQVDDVVEDRQAAEVGVLPILSGVSPSWVML